MPSGSDELVITEVRERRRGRVAVYINDEFSLTARASDLALIGWSPGSRVTEDQLKRARLELEYGLARSAAESFLAHRARSETEVRQRLQQKEFSPSAIDAVLQSLQRQGYISDKAFAAAYAEAAPRRRVGRTRIAAELRRRGVDSEIAKEAASQVTETDEKEAAFEFALRRAAGTLHLDPVTRKRRLVAALSRRGFNYDTIRSVISRVLNTHDEDDEYLRD